MKFVPHAKKSAISVTVQTHTYLQKWQGAITFPQKGLQAISWLELYNET